MLDTIVFEVHNLNENQPFMNAIEALSFNRTSTRYNYEERKTELQEPKTRQTRWLNFTDSGKHKEYSNYKLTSSHYSIDFKLDYDANKVTFQLSIPKYLYGTNLLQFVSEPFTKNGYSIGTQDFQDFHRLSKNLYSRLISFITRFFNDNFSMVEPPLTTTRIKRLDFCYNQYFATKEQAMNYLSDLKQVHRRYARQDGTQEYRETYATSVTHKFSGGFFKVYHKGTEYAKTDKPIHNKLNRLNADKFNLTTKQATENFYNQGTFLEQSKKQLPSQYELFPTRYLQAQADCILRYEITLHNEYINYLYINKEYKGKPLLKPECGFFQSLWQRNKRLYQQITDNEETEIQNPNPKKRKTEPTIKVPLYTTLSKAQKHEIKYFKAAYHKTYSFFIRIPDNDENWHTTENDNPDLFYSKPPTEALFTPELLQVCLQKFLSEIEAMMLKKQKTLKEIITKDGKNFLTGEKLPNINLRATESTLNLFNEYKWNISAIIADGVLTRTTAYRWQRTFYKLGLTRQNISEETDTDLLDWSFAKYYEMAGYLRINHPALFHFKFSEPTRYKELI